MDTTERTETYAYAVMGSLNCDPYVNRRNVTVCVNEEHEKVGPWLEGVGCPFALARVRAVIAVADEEIRQAKAEAWDEGFARAEYMARCWGHTDYWGEEDPYPTNPYR